MRKFNLFPLALAAIAFSACTSEEVAENNPSTGEGTTSYVAVNINNVGASGTRADGNYESGKGAENTISKVRFYFFTQSGQPYKMTNNASYVDAVPTLTQGTDENVEKFSNAILVINGESKAAPYSMMAVVNPETLDAGVLKEEMSRQEVEQAVAQKAFLENENAANSFVMTSSVYAMGGEKMWTSDISGYVQTSAAAAEAKPVDIFVERVATKLVTVTSGITKLADNTTPAYEVGKTTEGTVVYAKIKGWGVDVENTKANLIKSIDATWTDDALGFSATNPWNVEAYHRCFWETSSSALATTKKKYNDYATASEKPYYTLPNTVAPSKYVVAAQLVYADGTAAEICSYKGVEYLSEGDVKNVILAENKQFYKKVEGARDNRKNLEANDIKFVVHNGYEVKAQLNGTFELYKKVGGEYVEATAEEVNNALGTTAAQIRKGGMAYYYTNINHFGKENSTAQYGLVRNHVYKIDINSIKGFGTPVYDPDSGFDPIIPDETQTYLAAKINVLSWRIVKQTVDLGK